LNELRNERRPNLVIGAGNGYRSDDAVGLLAVQRLREKLPEQVAVLERSGEGAILMETWKDAEFVLVVDAVQSGAAPGTIYRFEANQQPIPNKFFHYSTHAFSVAEAIELARALNELPPRLVVYGIEGKCFEAGERLSPEVEKAIPEVVERIVNEVQNHYASQFTLRMESRHVDELSENGPPKFAEAQGLCLDERHEPCRRYCGNDFYFALYSI
jgi:hydrogenase maturation protease